MSAMDPGRGADGYRRTAIGGCEVRADIIEAHVFRRSEAGPEFLQLLRSRAPLDGTWQPVLGHCEAGESAAACAKREVEEEVGLHTGDEALLGLWALEQVHPYFVARINCIVLSPRFLMEVRADWRPRLNAEHREHRWVRPADVDRHFVWPGQKAAIREALAEIIEAPASLREQLRLDPAAP